VSASRPTGGSATVDDLVAVARERAVEIVNGELVDKASPRFDHGNAQSGVDGSLFGFRGSGGPRGPGGWWIAVEVEVEYEPIEVYRHDLVGWRRERVATSPTEWPVTTRPDWACEILSPSNASTDTVKKLRTLHRHGVPHYWLLDPVAGTLRVMRWTRDGYLEAMSASADEVVRAEPFDAIELSMKDVLGRD